MIIECKDTGERTGIRKYWKTKHWKKIKKEYNKKYKRECAVCGRKGEGLHLYHKTYDRIGNERLEDLEYLCKECYSNIKRSSGD